jgi:tetratricopeptide (TPR) repeat protein
MPPEQARGEIDQLDERSDVFGLGAILCVILTGNPPIHTGTTADVLAQAAKGDLTESYTRLDACGAEQDLIHLAKRCLAARMEGRPRNAGEVAAAIEAFQTGMQERLRTAELERVRAEVRGAEERKRRRLTVGLAVAVIVVLGFIGTGAWWVDRQQAEEQRRADDQRRSVEAALEQTVALMREERWEAAKGAFRLAEGQLDESTGTELLARVKTVRDHLDLASRLDTVRMRRSLLVNGRMSTASAAPAYADAFHAHTFDILRGEMNDLARRLSESPVKEYLLMALDDWIGVEKDQAAKRRVGLVANVVDGDEWRVRLRELLIGEDPRTLAQFAAEFPVERLTVPLAERLGRGLEKNRGDGVRVLMQMWQTKPRDFWLNYTLGSVLTSRRGRPEEAAGFYRAALAIRPDSVGALNNLGMDLASVHEIDAALPLLLRAVELEREDPSLLANLSSIYYEKRDFVAAQRCIDEALTIDPHFTPALANLGLLHVARGDRDSAFRVFNQAVELGRKEDHRQYPNAQVMLGNILVELGDHDGAMQMFGEALEIDPGLMMAHFNLARLLWKRNNPKEALAVFRKAEEMAPRNPDVHINIGLCLKLLGSNEGALAAFRRGVELAPRAAENHYTLASHLRSLGERLSAMEVYRRVLEINPRHARAWSDLGLLIQAGGDLDGAIDAHRKATDVDARYAVGFHNLAHTLTLKNDWQEAATACRRAVALEPNNPTGAALMAHIHLHLGQFREARDEGKRALALLKPDHVLHATTTKDVLNAEAFLQADEDLAALERRENPPLPVPRQLKLAELCLTHRNRPLLSVRFFSSAFTLQPSLLDNTLTTRLRVSAARAALLASEGHGDAKVLKESERPALRMKALAWIQADLAAWQNSPGNRTRVRNVLTLMKQDEAYASVREGKRREKLPNVERQAWDKVWKDVEDLLK